MGLLQSLKEKCSVGNQIENCQPHALRQHDSPKHELDQYFFVTEMWVRSFISPNVSLLRPTLLPTCQ